MMTSAQARDVLDTVTQKHKERWMATVNTIIVELLEAFEQQAAVVGEAHDTAEKVKNALIRLIQGGKKPVGAPASAGPPVEAEAPAEPAPQVDQGEPTVGADGSALSPEQAALEAQMNAAITGAPPAPQRGKRRGPAPSNGGTPEQRQSSIEEQMDAAIKG